MPAKYTSLLTARLDNRIVLLFFVVGVLILGLCIWFFQDTSEQSRRDAEAYRIEFKSRHVPVNERPRYWRKDSTVANTTTSGGSVRGKCIAVSDHRPLAEVSIDLNGKLPGGQNVERTVVSDSDGVFQANDVSPGTYTVQLGSAPAFRRPQVNVQPESFNISAGELPVNIDLRIGEATVIAGQVIDAKTKEPIRDFVVQAVPTKDKSRMDDPVYGTHRIADPDGRFVLEGLVQGTHELYVEAAEHAWSTRRIDYGPGVSRFEDVKVELFAQARIRGSVRNARGKSVEGASISPPSHFASRPLNEYPDVSRDVFTTSAGAFELLSLPVGPVQLIVQHDAYPPKIVECLTVAGQTTNVDVLLDDGGTVRGTVRLGGALPAEAEVWIHMLEHAPIEIGKDFSGTFEFVAVPAGANELYVEFPGKPATAPRVVQLSINVVSNETTEVNIEIPAGRATVTGQIIENGLPKRNWPAFLVLQREYEDQRIDRYLGITGEDGNFVFENVPAGISRVIAGSYHTLQGEESIEHSVDVSVPDDGVVSVEVAMD